MRRILLEHFRGFEGTHEVALAPLTLLVGENSTGKSSFLAACRLAWDLADGRSRLDFNERPFNLGAFSQIASYVGGSAGRARSFTIGGEFDSVVESSRDSLTVVGEFAELRAQPMPRVISASLSSRPFSAEVHYDDGDASEVRLHGARSSSAYSSKQDDEDPEFIRRDWHYQLAFARPKRGALARELNLLVRSAITADKGRRPAAVAPVRTQPQRTYDPVNEPPTPEGQHVPMLLATRLAETARRQNAPLKQQLESFGSAAGLFKSLRVQSLGKAGDPFQIMVKPSGVWRNLIDVGYGVSQSLPLLVALLDSSPRQMLLVQQPEVHLHPRAQAEFGSLAASVVANRRCQLLIETHSDHLVDRVRMDVRDRNVLAPDDVTVLYFEQDGPRTRIHPMHVDVSGNLVNAPRGYRSFFLREDARFFGAE